MVRPRPSSPPPGPEPVGLGGKPRRRCPHPHAAAWAGRSSRRPRRRPARGRAAGTVDLSRREAIPVTYPASTWATEENTWPSSPSSRGQGGYPDVQIPRGQVALPPVTPEKRTQLLIPGKPPGKFRRLGHGNGPQPLHPGGKTPVKRDLTHDRLHGLAPKRPVPSAASPMARPAAPPATRWSPGQIQTRRSSRSFPHRKAQKAVKVRHIQGLPHPFGQGVVLALFIRPPVHGSRGLREA